MAATIPTAIPLSLVHEVGDAVAARVYEVPLVIIAPSQVALLGRYYVSILRPIRRTDAGVGPLGDGRGSHRP